MPPLNSNRVVPRLSVLTAEQIEYTHSRSLRILAEVGVRVDSPEARRVLRPIQGVRFIDGDRATFAAEAVEWALQTAPRRVEIYDRSGGQAFCLGEDRTRFGIGVTNLYYQDPATDAVSPFSRAHMALSTRMAQQLPAYDLVSTIGIIQDYPPENADLYAVLEMAANTVRPLALLVSADELFSAVLDLLAALCGGNDRLREKPCALIYVNPITPLVINAGTAEKTLLAAERGLPVIYSNYGMAGMSTPITAAGTLTLMNAELLAGLVLTQAARPGAAVILGCLPAFFDMRSMQDFYDPHTMLINLACAEMMAHYGMPHAGTSGSGSGWGADLSASGLMWMNHITSLLGKCGLAPFVGGALGSKVFSPALAVYANDVILQALRLAQGFDLDDESAGLGEILARSPGVSFLDSELTLSRYKQAYFDSRIFPRLSLERWEALGRPRQDDYLRRRTQEVLETARPPEDHAELIEVGERWIARRA